MPRNCDAASDRGSVLAGSAEKYSPRGSIDAGLGDSGELVVKRIKFDFVAATTAKLGSARSPVEGTRAPATAGTQNGRRVLQLVLPRAVVIIIHVRKARAGPPPPTDDCPVTVPPGNNVI